MRKRMVLIFALLTILIMASCNGLQSVQNNQSTEHIEVGEGDKVGNDKTNPSLMDVASTEKMTELEDGLSAVRYEGDYGFDEFISGGGASSDGEVIKYLTENLLGDLDLEFAGEIFGCSTITVQNAHGKVLFGRNFDWNSCDALVVTSYPKNAYASVSTVNVDFIRQGAGGVTGLALKAEEIRTIAALYAPLDGMNEKGFAISVNMIQDLETINQDTEKPDITTTTAVRLLLDKAGTVEEALKLLGQYDMHASMGMMIHLSMADALGNSVVVEYIGNKMEVTKTPVVTNFYLTEGEKYGIGTEQSHERYDILMSCLKENKFMGEMEIRDALDRVSKDNFDEFESTEWSIVFNLSEGKATYYHRENYLQGYVFAI